MDEPIDRVASLRETNARIDGLDGRKEGRERERRQRKRERKKEKKATDLLTGTDRVANERPTP